MSLTCSEIEIYLSNYFNCRQNIIVPNIGNGLNIHECDLLIIRKSGYATEIEIKTSVQDIKADLKKSHKHQSNKIREFYFAIPKELEHAIEFIPKHAGIITIEKHSAQQLTINMLRGAKLNTEARKLTSEEICKVGHLAAMRIWNLKRTLLSTVQTLKLQNAK
jgi:hypothetical protein